MHHFATGAFSLFPAFRHDGSGPDPNAGGLEYHRIGDFPLFAFPGDRHSRSKFRLWNRMVRACHRPDHQLRLRLNNFETEGSGLTLAPVDEAARTHLKIPKGQGLIATSVSPQSAAARAGVCQNDIFLTSGMLPWQNPRTWRNN